MWLYTFESHFIGITQKSGHEGHDYKGGLLYQNWNLVFIQRRVNRTQHQVDRTWPCTLVSQVVPIMTRVLNSTLGD